MLAFYLSLTRGDDEEKFEKLYLRYRGLMLSRAYEILLDAQLAEDAVHNAFLRLLRNLSKLDRVDRPETKGYVMIVLENTAKTMYSKRKKQKISQLDENFPEKGDIQRDTEIKLTAQLAAEKIYELPDKYRDVLVLRYINELSDKEIASALAISDTAARKRLQRARERLRELMGGNNG